MDVYILLRALCNAWSSLLVFAQRLTRPIFLAIINYRQFVKLLCPIEVHGLATDSKASLILLAQQ